MILKGRISKDQLLFEAVIEKVSRGFNDKNIKIAQLV